MIQAGHIGQDFSVYKSEITIATGRGSRRAASPIIRADTPHSSPSTSSGIQSEARNLKYPLYLGYTNQAHRVSIGLPGCSNLISKLRTI